MGGEEGWLTHVWVPPLVLDMSAEALATLR